MIHVYIRARTLQLRSKVSKVQNGTYKLAAFRYVAATDFCRVVFRFSKTKLFFLFTNNNTKRNDDIRNIRRSIKFISNFFSSNSIHVSET